MTFSEQTELALKNYAASADVIREATGFFEANRAAIDRTMKAYRAAQGSASVIERYQNALALVTAAEKAVRDAGGPTNLETIFSRASKSLAGMDAVLSTGAYQAFTDWSFNEPQVQVAAVSATAAALVGVAEDSLTVEALHDEITEAATAVTVSYDDMLPEVSAADAVRFAIWMVVAPMLLVLWDDPLMGPWLQTHIDLLAVLVVLTQWGLNGVIGSPSAE